MNKIRQTWKCSLATFALLAAVNHQTPTTAAAEPGADNTPAADSPATTPSISPTANRDAPTPASPEQRRRELDRVFRARYGLLPASNRAALSAAEKEMLAHYGFPPSSINAPQPGGTAPAEAAVHGTQIEAKLKSIIIPEIMFDGLPMSEVIRILSDQCRKLDPDGVNFLINPNPPPVDAVIDPTTGLPLSATPPERLDLSMVQIKFALPLRNITMKDLLDAIVRVADMPIEYSVEDYGVVFSLGPRTVRGLQVAGGGSSGTRLTAHTFKVDTNTFVAGLESAFGIKVDLPADNKGTSRSRQIQAALKDLLAELGIPLEGNRSVFYNEATGMVMVRVAPDDLETIAAAIQTLGGSPKTEVAANKK
jgi:hypothetical protein